MCYLNGFMNGTSIREQRKGKEISYTNQGTLDPNSPHINRLRWGNDLGDSCFAGFFEQIFV